MPRYEKWLVDKAKAESLLMYKVEIDRKYSAAKNKGGYTQVQGVCSKHLSPVLSFAMRVCDGMPLDEAMSRMNNELAELKRQEPS
jgi:hypothetical protein